MVGDKPNFIIARLPGNLTGEVIYKDSFGRYWTNEIPNQIRTGDRRAILYDNGSIKEEG